MNVPSLICLGPNLCYFFPCQGTLTSNEGVVPLLEDPTNEILMKFLDEEKANILQEQFSSVYTSEPDREALFIPARTTAQS